MPPRVSHFSTMTTSVPASMAATAAEIPAAPEPTTTTSASMSQAGASEARAASGDAEVATAQAAAAAVAAPATRERRERAGVKEALVMEELVMEELVMEELVVMGESPFGLVRSRCTVRRLAVNVARPALWPAEGDRLSHESVFRLSHERWDEGKWLVDGHA